MTNASAYVTFIKRSFNKLWTLNIDSLVSVTGQRPVANQQHWCSKGIKVKISAKKYSQALHRIAFIYSRVNMSITDGNDIQNNQITRHWFKPAASDTTTELDEVIQAQTSFFWADIATLIMTSFRWTSTALNCGRASVQTMWTQRPLAVRFSAPPRSSHKLHAYKTTQNQYLVNRCIAILHFDHEYHTYVRLNNTEFGSIIQHEDDKRDSITSWWQES